MDNNHTKHARGFHLREILITLAIMTIFCAITLPLYYKYDVHIDRLEAKASLIQLAMNMERYHIENDTYIGMKLGGIRVSTPQSYQLQIESMTQDDYLISATPLSNQAAKDNICGTYTLTALGVKGMRGKGSVRLCW